MSVCVRCGDVVERIWTVRRPDGRVCWACDPRVCVYCGRKWETHICGDHRCTGPARNEIRGTRWRPYPSSPATTPPGHKEQP